MKHVMLTLLLLSGICAFTADQNSDSAKTATPSHVGRYQLYFGPHARADIYLVDTETGKIWTPITIENKLDINLKRAPEVWIYQERVDNQREFDIWSLAHKDKEAPTNPMAPQ